MSKKKFLIGEEKGGNELGLPTEYEIKLEDLISEFTISAGETMEVIVGHSLVLADQIDVEGTLEINGTLGVFG